jgi:hypothetical protein
VRDPGMSKKLTFTDRFFGACEGDEPLGWIEKILFWSVFVFLIVGTFAFFVIGLPQWAGVE